MSITDEEGEEVGEEAGDPELARQVLQKGYADLKARGLKEEVRLSPLFFPFLSSNCLDERASETGKIEKLTFHFSSRLPACGVVGGLEGVRAVPRHD